MKNFTMFVVMFIGSMTVANAATPNWEVRVTDDRIYTYQDSYKYNGKVNGRIGVVCYKGVKKCFPIIEIEGMCIPNDSYDFIIRAFNTTKVFKAFCMRNNATAMYSFYDEQAMEIMATASSMQVIAHNNVIMDFNMTGSMNAINRVIKVAKAMYK